MITRASFRRDTASASQSLPGVHNIPDHSRLVPFPSSLWPPPTRSRGGTAPPSCPAVGKGPASVQASARPSLVFASSASQMPQCSSNQIAETDRMFLVQPEDCSLYTVAHVLCPEPGDAACDVGCTDGESDDLTEHDNSSGRSENGLNHSFSVSTSGKMAVLQATARNTTLGKKANPYFVDYSKGYFAANDEETMDQSRMLQKGHCLLGVDAAQLPERTSYFSAKTFLSQQLLKQIDKCYFCWFLDASGRSSIRSGLFDLADALDASGCLGHQTTEEVSYYLQSYCENQRLRSRCAVYVLVDVHYDTLDYFMKTFAPRWGAHILLLPPRGSILHGPSGFFSICRQYLQHVQRLRLPLCLKAEARPQEESTGEVEVISLRDKLRRQAERIWIPQFILQPLGLTTASTLGINPFDRGELPQTNANEITDIVFDSSWLLKILEEVHYSIIFTRLLAFIVTQSRLDPYNVHKDYQNIKSTPWQCLKRGAEQSDHHRDDDDPSLSHILKALPSTVVLPEEAERDPILPRSPARALYRLLECHISSYDAEWLHTLAVLPVQFPQCVFTARAKSSEATGGDAECAPSSSFVPLLLHIGVITQSPNSGTLAPPNPTYWTNGAVREVLLLELTQQEMSAAHDKVSARLLQLQAAYPDTQHQALLRLHDKFMRQEGGGREDGLEREDDAVTNDNTSDICSSDNDDHSVGIMTSSSPESFSFVPFAGGRRRFSRQTGTNFFTAATDAKDEAAWRRWRLHLIEAVEHSARDRRLFMPQLAPLYAPESARSFNDINGVPMLPSTHAELTPAVAVLFSHYARVLLRRREPLMAASALERALCVYLYNFECTSYEIDKKLGVSAPNRGRDENADAANSSPQRIGSMRRRSSVASLRVIQSFKKARVTTAESGVQSFLYAPLLLIIEKTYRDIAECYTLGHMAGLSEPMVAQAGTLQEVLHGGRRDTPARAVGLIYRARLQKWTADAEHRRAGVVRAATETIDAHAAQAATAQTVEGEQVTVIEGIVEGPEGAGTGWGADEEAYSLAGSRKTPIDRGDVALREVVKAEVNELNYRRAAKALAEEALRILSPADPLLVGEWISECYALSSVGHSFNQQDRLALAAADAAVSSFLAASHPTPVRLAFQAPPQPQSQMKSIIERRKELAWVRCNLAEFMAAIHSKNYTKCHEFLDKSVLFSHLGLVPQAPDVLVVCAGSRLSEDITALEFPPFYYYEHLFLHTGFTPLETARHHGTDWARRPVRYLLPAHELLRIADADDTAAVGLLRRLLATGLDPRCCSPHDMAPLLNLALERSLRHVLLLLLYQSNASPAYAPPYVLAPVRTGLSTVARMIQQPCQRSCAIRACPRDDPDTLLLLLLHSENPPTAHLLLEYKEYIIETLSSTTAGRVRLAKLFLPAECCCDQSRDQLLLDDTKGDFTIKGGNGSIHRGGTVSRGSFHSFNLGQAAGELKQRDVNGTLPADTSLSRSAADINARDAVTNAILSINHAIMEENRRRREHLFDRISVNMAGRKAALHPLQEIFLPTISSGEKTDGAVNDSNAENICPDKASPEALDDRAADDRSVVPLPLQGCMAPLLPLLLLNKITLTSTAREHLAALCPPELLRELINSTCLADPILGPVEETGNRSVAADDVGSDPFVLRALLEQYRKCSGITQNQFVNLVVDAITARVRMHDTLVARDLFAFFQSHGVHLDMLHWEDAVLYRRLLAEERKASNTTTSKDGQHPPDAHPTNAHTAGNEENSSHVDIKEPA